MRRFIYEPKEKGLVGRVIQLRREELGMSRPRLTRSIGCGSTMIGMIERGKAPFPFRRWMVYADALDVPRHEFLRIVIEEKYLEILPYVVFSEPEEGTSKTAGFFTE